MKIKYGKFENEVIKCWPQAIYWPLVADTKHFSIFFDL